MIPDIGPGLAGLQGRGLVVRHRLVAGEGLLGRQVAFCDVGVDVGAELAEGDGADLVASAGDEVDRASFEDEAPDKVAGVLDWFGLG